MLGEVANNTEGIPVRRWWPEGPFVERTAIVSGCCLAHEITLSLAPWRSANNACPVPTVTMIAIHRTRFSPYGHARDPRAGVYAIRYRAIWICLIVAAIRLTAEAQQTIATPSQTPTGPGSSPQAPSPPPALPPTSFSGTGVIPALSGAPGLPFEGSPLQWGPVSVRPHLFYRLLYGDGLQSSPGMPLTTAINSFAPGVLFGLGDKWTLDYTPTKTFYSNRAFNDTLDHAALLSGTTTYDEWALNFSQTYGLSSQPLVETGGQTKQETYATAIQVVYGMGDQMRLEMNAGQNVGIVENFPDTREWSTTDWLHFRYAPELDTAIGVGLGYVDVSPGPNMSYARPQVSVTWQVTPKTTFLAQGGIERRKSDASGAPDQNNGIYSASLQFHPVEATQISLQTSRSVGASYFEAQVTKNTSWGVNLDQRLLGEFHLVAGYAHQEAAYTSFRASVPTDRTDDFDSVNLRLATTFFRKLAVAALWQHSRNASNSLGYGFSSNQIGLEIGYRY